jgi:hypothetical protein
MIRLISKTVLCLLFALLIVGIFFCCTGRKVETYHDDYVKAGKIQSPINLFFAHVSEKRYLTINTRTYKGVRGFEPYYLKIPKLNSILFVTEGATHRVTFHVVNLMTKVEIPIDGETSGFGWNIGAGRKPGDVDTDYVESTQSNNIAIAQRSLNWKETTILNLDRRKIEREEILEYDISGQITNRKGVKPK